MKKTFFLSSLIIVNALIVMLVASSTFATERFEVIESDGSWKVTTRLTDEWVDCPGTIGEQGPEWTDVNFDDSGWGNSTAPWEWDGCESWPEWDQTRMWMGTVPSGPLEVFFRKSFSLDSLALSAEAEVYVDDNFQMYVNGVLVRNKVMWPAINVFDITQYLQVGENVFAFRAWDGDPNTNACEIYDHICEGLELIITIELPPAYSCVGFEPPMSNGPVTIKGKNRALPLKARLCDADGYPVTDGDIVAPPVIQVFFDSGPGGAPIDVTGDALPSGHGTEGNQFVFTDEGKWQYNLKTNNYTAFGTYLIHMDTGDNSEYVIEPTCSATFVIK